MNEAYYPSKKNHIAKMSVKLDEPNTAPKTFWSIISRFLEQKKNQPYHLFFLIVN